MNVAIGKCSLMFPCELLDLLWKKGLGLEMCVLMLLSSTTEHVQHSVH